MIALLYCIINSNECSILIYFSDPARRRDFGGGGDRDKKESVWSKAELQASNVAPARISIDWNMIRENKAKYEELKWKGKPAYCH